VERLHDADAVACARAIPGGWVGVGSGLGRPPRVIGSLGTATLETDAPPPTIAPRRRRASGPDGVPVHSWVVPAVGPSRGTLLWVHGGPLSQWSDAWHPRWNASVFAHAGYTLVMPNPRGSLGRGQAFAEAVGGNRWGGACVDDLHRALDEAGDDPAVDLDNVAVMGASFGGWASAWLAGTSTRFRCAVVHAGLSKMSAAHGETDVPGFMERHMGGRPDNTDMDRYSPIRNAPTWRTPTLITHGERDYRVPVGEALRLFEALQRHGVDSELLVFPDAHHWLVRPVDVEDWHEAVFSFLASHLG
jgi:dipeptidyl aminopeptidase/acylaminoacyl peptidase